MKKSIAFLGALLFGSVTFGQVTKKDTINKSLSRKVSSEDLKKFPEDVDVTTNIGGIKGETLEKHKGDLSSAREGKKEAFQKVTFKQAGIETKSTPEKHSPFEKQATFEKHSSDATAGQVSGIKGSVTQKGKIDESTSPAEKQHYTVKMTNANNKTQTSTTEKMGSVDGETTTQKKHISNIKWTPGKVAKDSLPTPTTKSSEIYMKIGDIKGEKE